MGTSFNPFTGEIIVNITDAGETVTSNPPTGKLRVKNLFVDAETGRLEVEYSDVPTELWDYVTSNPPVGNYKVRNLFVDPETGKLEVEWDDTPAEE